ncbi:MULTISPECIES: nucleotidyl cyclase domain-containing protein [unclassified Streptomyces]|uniref:hypothetical protein n=1 Tax=Streptomyces sp. NPDC127129 TaxID=3345373 RepID=UPI00362D5CE5
MSSAGASAGAIHRLVVFGDAVGSGTLGMDAKKLMRSAMYGAFGEAYAAIGVEPGAVHQEDRGDGILGALRPDVPPTFVVGRWIDTLYESLREHNAGRRDRLRMRVGINAGLVLEDGHGLVGRAVDLACRLCDSPTAKQIMTDAPDADLLVVVSDWLYANVVVEGGRYVEPAHYRQARVRSKETDETAWFHIPRRPEPPLSGPGAGDPRTGGGPARGDGPPPIESRRYHAGRDVNVFEGNTIHGGFTGIRNDRSASRDEGEA